jgi:uncharacterized protein YraI
MAAVRIVVIGLTSLEDSLVNLNMYSGEGTGYGGLQGKLRVEVMEVIPVMDPTVIGG